MVEAPPDIRWHFIGHLQKKMVPKVTCPFVLIHSVDSVELAEHIAELSQKANTTTSILLQANTSGEVSKQGLTPEIWKREFEKVARLPHLKIEGLMTMAPLIDDEKIIRSCFANLRKLRGELGLKHLSMGMSQDFAIAIQEGATLLRIGTAIFKN
jgi:pyridoxal phosphate enzyme (YggS family)